MSLPEGTQASNTDNDGKLVFGVPAPGHYRIDVQKEGYRSQAPGGDSATVSVEAGRPSGDLKFLLVHSETLTGRFVEEDTDEPIVSLRAAVLRLEYFAGRVSVAAGTGVITDSDGRFEAAGLRPGDYVVRIMSRMFHPAEGQSQPAIKGRGTLRASDSYTERDLPTTDWDYEQKYWPGGSELSTANSVPLADGGRVNLGTIHVRRATVYRVHVSVTGDCHPGEVLHAEVISVSNPFGFQGSPGDFACGKDFLMRGFAPGTYRLELIVDGRNRANRAKGFVEFAVSDRNCDVIASVARGVDIEGRFTFADGSGKPDLKPLKISLAAFGNFVDDYENPIDAQGRFRIVNVAVRKQTLSITGLSHPFYVKEVRYNGRPIVNQEVSIDGTPGPQSIEVVIDDKAGSVAGVVAKDGTPVSAPHVALVPWPVGEDGAYRSLKAVEASEHGSFQFVDLTPGEYRLFAIPAEQKDKLQEPNVLPDVLGSAQKVVVGPGGFQSVSLPLTVIP